MSNETIETILNYWFEGIDDTTVIDKNVMPFKKWFLSSAKIDEEIRLQFKSVLEEAAQGMYKHWEGSSRGRLALILLYDQFSRNIFRGTAQMYAYDALALALTMGALDRGLDQELELIQRIFLYMPLMHFADLKMQEISTARFSGLVAESKAKHPVNTPYYKYTLKHATRHRDTIARYGRFPSREKILKNT